MGVRNLYESKYQHSDDVEEIIASWTAEDMLPRNYKDERRALGDLSRKSFDAEVARS